MATSKCSAVNPCGRMIAGFGFSGKSHIIHHFARITVKMAMLAHVRAEPGGAAVNLHLARQPAFDQGIEAVIDRGHGNVRHPVFGTEEDLLRRRMIALLQQHVIDVLALRREPEPARGQALVQIALNLFLTTRLISRTKLNPSPELVNTWNNSKHRVKENLG